MTLAISIGHYSPQRKAISIMVRFMALLIAGSATAQVQNGNISGTVKDQQGGVLPGVTAVLRGVDATRSTASDASGEFRFLELAPGPYTLTFSIEGFQTIIRENLIVEVGKHVDVALAMKVAPIKDTVTVVASGARNRPGRRANPGAAESASRNDLTRDRL